MDLLKETKDLCKLYGIHPARSRGQNFLINQTVYDQVVAAANLQSSDTVLEVGPGFGFLTFLLAKQAKQVIAVELDRRLAEVLKSRLEMKGVNNVEIIQGDILDFLNPKFQITNFKSQKNSKSQLLNCYKVVANLPYNITSIFLRKFLTSERRPQTLTLLLQKEVAERLAARAGAMSLLGLSVQFYAEPQFITAVDKKNFWPEPEVMSAIIHLKTKSKLPLKENEIKLFFRLARIGFSAKRKMLKNNLAAGLAISSGAAENYLIKAGLKPTCRPQDLGLDDWLGLFVLINHKSQIPSSPPRVDASRGGQINSKS